jgi:hypothetical protein
MWWTSIQTQRQKPFWRQNSTTGYRKLLVSPKNRSTIEIISTVGNHIIHASILVATPWIPSLEWTAS